jgi:hypothetical protein
MPRTVLTTIALGALTCALLAPAPVGAAVSKSPRGFCDAAGGESGTKGYEKCVSLAKKAKEEARGGSKKGGDAKKKAKGAAGKFCKANKAKPGSRAYKSCIGKAKRAEKAARKRGGGGGGGGGGGDPYVPSDPYVPGDPYVP